MKKKFDRNWVLGKTIVGVETMTTRHRDRSVISVECIVLSDGSRITFTVGEREDGRYDIVPKYHRRAAIAATEPR